MGCIVSELEDSKMAVELFSNCIGGAEGAIRETVADVLVVGMFEKSGGFVVKDADEVSAKSVDNYSIRPPNAVS